MTLSELWRLANSLVITDHAVDRYFQRSPGRQACTAAHVDELVRAELIRSWSTTRLQEVLEAGAYPRIAVMWRTEPLVTLIRPAPEGERPVVLTILSFAMYDQSRASGRYQRAA